MPTREACDHLRLNGMVQPRRVPDDAGLRVQSWSRMQPNAVRGPEYGHRDERDHDDRTREPECVLRPGRRIGRVFFMPEQFDKRKSDENWENQNPRMLGSQRETGR